MFQLARLQGTERIVVTVGSDQSARYLPSSWA